MKRILRPHEVAADLGVSRRRVYDLVRRGAIPGVIRVGRTIFIRREPYEQWRMLTVPDVAQALRVHPDTVRSWLRSGRLGGVFIGGRGGWRIPPEALERFVQKIYRPPQADEEPRKE